MAPTGVYVPGAPYVGPNRPMLRGMGGGATPPPDPVGGPTDFTLTDISSGRLFQRTKALTTGPVAASGTYTGPDPNAVELQVLKVSDNSVVKDWTTASATIAGGNWSATVTGVPQGGSYYVKARPSNAVGLAQTGANPFYVGILIIMYGQSNMANMSITSASPPSAAAGTTYFSGSAWGAVPAGNGVREFLNAVTTATGVPAAAINGSISGSTIEYLRDETASGGAGLFYAQMAAAGVTDGELCIFMQGEGNANTAPATSEASYKNSISDLHGKLAAHLGRTKAQFPFVQAGLTTYGGTPDSNTDDTWSTIRTAQFHAAQEQPNVYFSHSNMDGARQSGDVYHLDAASQGRQGKRFAQTVNSILLGTGGPAHFEITGAATVDGTHTNVTIAHSFGATDFTPTSGITGFQVSGDNGGTWIPASGARIDASTIQLTHSSIATDNTRALRYQYGMLPDVSAPVKDNGANALPLTFTSDTIIPTPLATLPVPTLRTGTGMSQLTGNGQVQTASAIPIGPATARRLIILGTQGGNNNITSITFTPNVGSAVTATIVRAATSLAAIAYAVLGADADTATTVSISVDYGVNPFSGTRYSLWTVPSGDLSSPTPTGTGTIRNVSAASTIAVTLNTSAGGFMVGSVYAGTNPSSPNYTWSGTDTWTKRTDNNIGGTGGSNADASNVSTNAANSVSVALATTSTASLAVVAWR